MNQCTIVMYHYVRELIYTRYPEIKGLNVSQFKDQLDYLEKYYTFIKMEDLLNSHEVPLPANALLLSFDDAYLDHFLNIFPILDERGVQGSFFPPVKAIMEHEVLDVNKIHFILASTKNVTDLLDDIYQFIGKYRGEYQLEDNAEYFNRLAIANRFDTKEVVFVKRMLQVELPEALRKKLVDNLFAKYVSADEGAFSRELYMSVDQIKCMVRNGMYVGSHGYDHYWMNTLSSMQQEAEINRSLQFLRMVGSSTEDWVMCYPYGAWSESLIEILQRKNCRAALTTKVGIAELQYSNIFTLERLDTNDFPKRAGSEMVEWTKHVRKQENYKDIGRNYINKSNKACKKKMFV